MCRQKYKLQDEETNPCLKEHILVGKCITKEDYNYQNCEIFFENYRQCKRFWNKIRLERYNLGIEPNMPGKDEREKIMKEKREKHDQDKIMTG